MEGKLTIYFDDPFWVAVLERDDETGYQVARVVLGGEPSDAEAYQFFLENYGRIEFKALHESERPQKARVNFKRAQREARKSMQVEGVGTRAQEAMKAELAQHKQERREVNRQAREQEERERFLQRQEKKKEKHRGH
jgi:hypothetical protein